MKPRRAEGKVTSLRQVLKYRHPGVLERFRSEYPVTRKAAEGIWLDTLRWLWLGSCARGKSEISITAATVVLDEMWHAFILFTQDYTAFCETNLGGYIHHAPTTHAESRALLADVRAERNGVLERFEQATRAQFELVAKELGADTLKRWYIDYPAKYSPEALERLRAGAIRG
jgi:hypothetical protein